MVAQNSPKMCNQLVNQMAAALRLDVFRTTCTRLWEVLNMAILTKWKTVGRKKCKNPHLGLNYET